MPGTDLTSRMFRFTRSYTKLSVREMAQELGLHRSSLSRIELAKTYPSDKALDQLRHFVRRTPALPCSCLHSLISIMRRHEGR